MQLSVELNNNKVNSNLLSDKKQVRFGAYSIPLKQIQMIPCAHCGLKMLTIEEVRQQAKFLAELKGGQIASHLDNLFKNFKSLKGTHIEIASLLINTAKSNPNASMGEILKIIFDSNHAPLNQHLTEFYKKMRRLANGLSKETQIIVKLALPKPDKIVFQQTFLSKKQEDLNPALVIQNLRDLKDLRNTNINDVKILSDMLMEANDYLDFKRKKVMFINRNLGKTPQAFLEQFLSFFQMTTDHIIERKGNGASVDKVNNYLGVHGFCNYVRGHKPFPLVVQESPSVLDNLHNYFAALRKGFRDGYITPTAFKACFYGPLNTLKDLGVPVVVPK